MEGQIRWMKHWTLSIVVLSYDFPVRCTVRAVIVAEVANLLLYSLLKAEKELAYYLAVS